MEIQMRSIGSIHTPYFDLNAPHQPLKDASGEFWITVDPDYSEALEHLASYKYIYVLSYLDKARYSKNRVHPSWAPEIEVGLFASRSPNRPNPIGISVVEIKAIEGNEIVISGIDVYNGTPLLDIKPYVKALDAKEDANDGWYDQLEDKEHSLAHMLGLSHEHSGDEAHFGHHHENRHAHSHHITQDNAQDNTHEHTHHHAHTHTHRSNDHPHGHSHPQVNRHTFKYKRSANEGD